MCYFHTSSKAATTVVDIVLFRDCFFLKDRFCFENFAPHPIHTGGVCRDAMTQRSVMSVSRWVRHALRPCLSMGAASLHKSMGFASLYKSMGAAWGEGCIHLCRAAVPIDFCRDAAPIDLYRDVAPIDL